MDVGTHFCRGVRGFREMKRFRTLCDKLTLVENILSFAPPDIVGALREKDENKNKTKTNWFTD